MFLVGLPADPTVVLAFPLRCASASLSLLRLLDERFRRLRNCELPGVPREDDLGVPSGCGGGQHTCVILTVIGCRAMFVATVRAGIQRRRRNGFCITVGGIAGAHGE